MSSDDLESHQGKPQHFDGIENLDRRSGIEAHQQPNLTLSHHWLCLLVWCEPTERLAYVGPPLRRQTSVAVPESSHDNKTFNICGRLGNPQSPESTPGTDAAHNCGSVAHMKFQALELLWTGKRKFPVRLPTSN